MTALLSRLPCAARALACGVMLAACRSEAREPPPPAPAPVVAAPAPSPRAFDHERPCMGTLCQIKIFHSDEDLAARAASRAFDELARIEALTTSWRDSSEVSAINRAAGKAPVKVSPDTLAVVQKGLWVAALTDGAFDITVGVYKGLWKFDEDNDGSLPKRADVLARRKLVNWRDVIVDEAASTVMLRRPGQRLNLEGLAKGYGVDAAVAALRAAGASDFIVHAGGDLYAGGRKGDRAWRVGIQDPRAPHGRIIFQIELADQAFNTSGDYERFIIKDGVRYHHILDARTGYPAKSTRSVTILAKSAFLADTLDTAIFAVGPERGMKIVEELPDVEAVIVDAKNRVLVSSGLAGRIQKTAEPSDGI